MRLFPLRDLIYIFGKNKSPKFWTWIISAYYSNKSPNKNTVELCITSEQSTCEKSCHVAAFAARNRVISYFWFQPLIVSTEETKKSIQMTSSKTKPKNSIKNASAVHDVRKEQDKSRTQSATKSAESMDQSNGVLVPK